MAADGRVHRPARHRRPVHHGQILAFDAARLQLFDQGVVGAQAAGDHQQAGRVLIQAVDQAGARQQRQLGGVMQQRVDQGAVAVAGGGMGHQAGRFVQRQQILVFIADIERNVLGDGDGFRLQDRLAADALAAPHGIAGPDDPAVDPQLAGLEPLLQAAAGIRRQRQRQRLIEPHPGAIGGYLTVDPFARRHDGF